jgi:hypothetical protein
MSGFTSFHGYLASVMIIENGQHALQANIHVMDGNRTPTQWMRAVKSVSYTTWAVASGSSDGMGVL